MLQTSSGGFFRRFAVRCASELLWGLPVRVMRGGGGGGWADNVYLCRVHRAGSMKWLALLLYVVLVLRLSNVADLRLLPLTPLLRFPLVEVEEHLEALLWWSEPGTAEAVVQHAIVTECRQGRIPWSQLLSFAPALGLLLWQ